MAIIGHSNSGGGGKSDAQKIVDRSQRRIRSPFARLPFWKLESESLYTQYVL